MLCCFFPLNKGGIRNNSFLQEFPEPTEVFGEKSGTEHH